MSIAERLPGTGEWLLARINAQVGLRLRKELRRLQRDLDAVFVGLWVATNGGDVLVEFAGEIAIAPSRCPLVDTSIPTFESFVGADGAQHEAVMHRPRLGRGMPRLGMLVADAAGADAGAMFDVTENSGQRIEEILVDAIAA